MLLCFVNEKALCHTEQYMLSRSKLYDSNNGLTPSYSCGPKACHEITFCPKQTGLTVFPSQDLYQCFCNKYVIKYAERCHHCYFIPNSAPFLLISSLAKSESIHISCYGFGIHHYLKG